MQALCLCFPREGRVRAANCSLSPLRYVQRREFCCQHAHCWHTSFCSWISTGSSGSFVLWVGKRGNGSPCLRFPREMAASASPHLVPFRILVFFGVLLGFVFSDYFFPPTRATLPSPQKCGVSKTAQDSSTPSEMVTLARARVFFFFFSPRFLVFFLFLFVSPVRYFILVVVFAWLWCGG